ncbi:hypothetical protein GCM10022224_065050 [Nonomuraea antimicrobica]|uniref:PknH-like extracellular domain-containing protein n=2 Tax=Nonomuraea antimicrobica TaxID=561173 RepID=A0ABP7CLA9_9ACTN
MPFRRCGTALALTLLAGAASACSATQADSPLTSSKPSQSSTQPGKVAAVPEPGAAARRLVFPFDAYNFSPAEVMTREVAEDLLVRDCMKDLGLAWQALPGPAESENDPPHRRRYGVIEPQIADVFGYHAPPQRPAVIARKTQDLARITAAPPNTREAAGRCLDRARDDMTTGAPKADAAFFNKTIFATFDASQRDGKVTQAFHSWSQCMANEGFRYPDPLTAITDPRWQTKEPSAQEIRAAQTDVRCKEKTNLVPIWTVVEERIQNDAIRAHPKKFQALKTVKDKQLEIARRTIARN